MWRCMREKGVPEKYVRIVKDTFIYVEARTKVKSSVGLISTIAVRVGLRQGSSLGHRCTGSRHQLEQPPWCLLFADDIVPCSTRREEVERKLEEWRKAI